jgi:hypothetical protein
MLLEGYILSLTVDNDDNDVDNDIIIINNGNLVLKF